MREALARFETLRGLTNKITKRHQNACVIRNRSETASSVILVHPCISVFISGSNPEAAGSTACALLVVGISPLSLGEGPGVRVKANTSAKPADASLAEVSLKVMKTLPWQGDPACRKEISPPSPCRAPSSRRGSPRLPGVNSHAGSARWYHRPCSLPRSRDRVAPNPGPVHRRAMIACPAFQE